MERVFKLLYRIEKNPALYFGGRENVALLRAMLDGYMEAIREMDQSFQGTFALGGFQDFVQSKYNNLFPSHSWDNIIDFYSSSDREAWERFYKLLDEFLGDKKDLYA